MPTVSAKQHHFMLAIAHGWHKPGGGGPPVSVAKEFVAADQAKKKNHGGRIAAALHTAREYGKKYADGGDVKQLEDIPPPPPGMMSDLDMSLAQGPRPREGGLMQTIPMGWEAMQTPEGRSKLAQAARMWWKGEEPGQSQDNADVIGNIGKNPVIKPFVEMVKGPHEAMTGNMTREQAADWGAGTALGLIGVGSVRAKTGELGVAGGKPEYKKFGNYKDELYDLHPDELKQFQQESGPMGSNPGGLYRDPEGQQWYVKNPQTLDHARNEKLATELYKLAGVPVADLRLTELNGKPAVASPIIEGSPLRDIPDGLYGDTAHLRDHLPADAWLANYDAIGTGKDNVIVDFDWKAHRIDMGGALRYRAQGKPKADWGPVVKEFETMRDPKINADAADVFGGGELPGKETAERIAAIPPEKIAQLVEKYGPSSQAAKTKLVADLVERQRQVAAKYGIEPGKTGGIPPLQNQGEPSHIAKGAADHLVRNYKDPGKIAKHLHEIANENGPHVAEEIFRALPDGLKPLVDAEIRKLSIEKYEQIPFEPGADDFPMPEPDVAPTFPVDMNHPLQKQINLMKNGEVKWDGEPTIFDKYSPSEIADNMLGAQLTTKQMKNIYSWMDPVVAEAVDNAIANKFGAGSPEDMFGQIMGDVLQKKKYDDPAYVESVEREAQAYFDEIRKHAKKPPKSEAEREADRIAGGFTTEAYKGVDFHENLEHPFRSGESFQTAALDVAHAYAAWRNSAADPKYWDPVTHRNEWKNAGVQPLYLNTQDFIRVDAGGKSWATGNDLAMQMKFEMESQGARPTGAIIENVHDMPHEPYEHPTGKPFTVYWAWDPSVRRSKFARFDRSFWNKPGLHLSVSGLGLLGLTQGVLIKKQGEEGMAAGGRVSQDKWMMHQASKNLHSEGLTHSAVPGRTDKLPRALPAGAYVLPAETVSALGQNNTLAGGAIAKAMFSRGPMGMAPMKGASRTNIPRLNMRPQSTKIPNYGHADGGEANGEDETVPTILAGGEFIIHPDVVKDIGHGSLTAGHKILDQFVLKVRKEHISTLKKLKPPKK